MGTQSINQIKSNLFWTLRNEKYIYIKDKKKKINTNSLNIYQIVQKAPPQRGELIRGRGPDSEVKMVICHWRWKERKKKEKKKVYIEIFNFHSIDRSNNNNSNNNNNDNSNNNNYDYSW